jgi:hypothetical protein
MKRTKPWKTATPSRGEKVATVSAIGDGDELQFKVNAQTAKVFD